MIAADLDGLAAAIAGNNVLADALGVEVTGDWPPEHLDEAALGWMLAAGRQDPRMLRGWGMWFVILKPAPGVPRVLVGNVGFKSPPDATGCVECGYSVIASHRRRGIAVEAVRALGDWAFSHSNVQSLAAETYPHLTESLGVMRRLGMRHIGAGSEPGVVRHAVTRQGWLDHWTT